MKKFQVFLFALMISFPLFPQSDLSLLTKAGGQLLQNLSNKKEFWAVGKALETVGDMTYEMEKIKAQNEKTFNYNINQSTNQSQNNNPSTRIPNSTVTQGGSRTNYNPNVSNSSSRRVSDIPDHVVYLNDKYFPEDGYKWLNENDVNDYRVEEIKRVDIDFTQRAYDLLRDNFDLLEHGDWNGYLDVCSRSIEISPTPEAYLLRSLMYTNARNYNEALIDVGRILNYNVDDKTFFAFYSQKASILKAKQDYQESIENYQLALGALDNFNSDLSDYCDTYSNLSDSYRGIGEYKQALVYCNKSIDVCPENFMGYYMRASIYSTQEEFDLAFVDLNYFDSDPNSNPFTKYLSSYLKAAIFWQMKDHRNALAFSNEALELYDSNNMSIAGVHALYYIRGVAKINIGAVKSGCEDLSVAFQIGNMKLDDFYITNCL